MKMFRYRVEVAIPPGMTYIPGNAGIVFIEAPEHATAGAAVCCMVDRTVFLMQMKVGDAISVPGFTIFYLGEIERAENEKVTP